MSDHPNAAMMRRALEAIRVGDAEPARAMWADEIEWHEIGRAEPLRSKEAMFAHLAEASPVEADFEVHDVIANDEHIVALTLNRASSMGRSIEYRLALVYHVREGKVVARWPLADDTQRVAELFASAKREIQQPPSRSRNARHH